jgi:hypothetical protein
MSRLFYFFIVTSCDEFPQTEKSEWCALRHSITGASKVVVVGVGVGARGGQAFYI